MNSVHLYPKNTDHVIVCNKTSSIYVMNTSRAGIYIFHFCSELSCHICICSGSDALYLAIYFLKFVLKISCFKAKIFCFVVKCK